jgi:hypothetical protein
VSTAVLHALALDGGDDATAQHNQATEWQRVRGHPRRVRACLRRMRLVNPYVLLSSSFKIKLDKIQSIKKL